MCHLMQQDYVLHSVSTTTVNPRHSATNFGCNLWRYFEGGHKSKHCILWNLWSQTFMGAKWELHCTGVSLYVICNVCLQSVSQINSPNLLWLRKSHEDHAALRVGYTQQSPDLTSFRQPGRQVQQHLLWRTPNVLLSTKWSCFVMMYTVISTSLLKTHWPKTTSTFVRSSIIKKRQFRLGTTHYFAKRVYKVVQIWPGLICM